jgi:AraC-like DNA-binding protein
VTLFHAERFQQRFARHSHEEYALGVITSGVLGFNYLGAHHLAGAGEVNLVVPGEMHTGQPELGEAWSYRMFYIQPALLQNIARQSGRDRGALPFFKPGVIKDRVLAATIIGLHHDLDAGLIAPLEAQSRWIALLAAWLRRYGESRRMAHRISQHAPDVARVREFLDDCWQQKPALDELAALAGLSPYQLLRGFVRQYGLPPHAYLIQQQVREARRLLDRGASICDAACACGFTDQSHLHRHFKRIWGVTPGQYRNFVQDGSRKQH